LGWTYTQVDGDTHLKSEVKIFTATEVAKSNFNPATSPPVYSAMVAGATESLILPVSINPDSYYTYVRVWSSFNAISLWVGRQFSVEGPAPSPPGDDNAGIAGTPGVGAATVTPNNSLSAVSIVMRDSSNLLSVNQADVEEVTDSLGYKTVNCAIVRDTTVKYPGGGLVSLKMTSSASGTMEAKTSFLECPASVPITVRGQFISAVSSRTAQIKARFKDENFADISEISADVTTATGTWNEATATGTSPVGTRYIEVVPVITSTAAANEVHYIDHTGAMFGTDSRWSNGGHTSRNILTDHLSNGDDPVSSSLAWISGKAGTIVQQVTAAGTGFGGPKNYRMTYAGVAPSLGFRATGTVFTSPTAGADFVLNKPAGTLDGDLMLAFVTSSEYGTINVPTGWTTISTAAVDDTTTDVALWVLKRSALTADPASWSGTLNTSSARRRAVVVSYSGASNVVDQPLAEGITTDSTGALNQTTATVNNTDANAWRVSAFASSDDATGTTMIANQEPPSSQASSIQYVGAQGATDKTSSTSYTLYRPPGLIDGDLLIATLVVSGNISTVTPPANWVLVRKTVATNGGNSVTVAILKKTALVEPSSWTGSMSSTSSRKTTGVVAYRNAELWTNQFIAENSATDISGSSLTTPTVTNTDSRAWRISVFGTYSTTAYFEVMSSTEVKERIDYSVPITYGYSAVTTSLGMYDSNGTVSTGSHSRTGTLSSNFYASVGWIGIIKPLPTPPAAPANETERTDGVTGSSTPWLHTAVYDSNGPVAVTNSSVTGQITPGSGTSVNSAATWIGIIRPANETTGTVVTRPTSAIDISAMDPEVLELADNKITIVSSFKGSSGGTPYLAVTFYNANQLILYRIEEGTPFGTSTYVKSSATFDIPENTTRILPSLVSSDRDVGDYVEFVRTGVLLGSSPVWRDGTGRAAHSVWSVPEIQFADNAGAGYTDWAALPGQKAYRPVYDPADGSVTYIDHTVTPLVSRKYRVQTKSFGLAGDTFASGYGPESNEVVVNAVYWWLKDLSDLTLNMQLFVKATPLGVDTINESTVSQPLGEDYPIVITEGYKGDVVDISVFIRRVDYAKLVKMLKNKRTLFLQSNMDNAWWVRPVGSIKSLTMVTADHTTNPLREVGLSFVQVAPEE
jgi:hypothetical protein